MTKATETIRSFWNNHLSHEDTSNQWKNGREVSLYFDSEQGAYYGTIEFERFTLQLTITKGFAEDVPIVIARGFLATNSTLLDFHSKKDGLFDWLNSYLVDNDMLLVEIYAYNETYLSIDNFVHLNSKTAKDEITYAVEGLIAFVEDAELFLDALVNEHLNPISLYESFCFCAKDKVLVSQERSKFFTSVVAGAHAINCHDYIHGITTIAPLSKSDFDQMLEEAELSLKKHNSFDKETDRPANKVSNTEQSKDTSDE